MIYLGAGNPSINTQCLFTIMTERGGTVIFCRILAPPQSPPHTHTAPTPQYLFILMGVMIFCMILAPPPPNGSPPTTPQYLTILMTEREGAIIFLQDFGAHPPPPNAPPPQTLQYLTILMTGRGGRQLQYPVRSKYIRILLLIL